MRGILTNWIPTLVSLLEGNLQSEISESCRRYQFIARDPGLAPGFFLLHPVLTESGKLRRRRSDLPFPALALASAAFIPAAMTFEY